MNKAEPFRARRISAKKYQLKWPGSEGQLLLCVTDSPRGVLNGELILETQLDASLGAAELSLPATSGSLFFHLQTPAGEEHIITDRALPAQGIRNFRDFGGYRTGDGRRVKWQMLYRSGHLGSLSDEDKQRVAALGITLVCDFRTPSEVNLNPSQFAEGYSPRVVQLNLDPGDPLEFLELMKQTDNTEILRSAARRKMLDINRLLAISKTGVYRNMFKAVLENNGPSLIHCTAGKDRTGFGAAIILTALGVPKETIFHDYLLTNEYSDPDKTLAWFKSFTGVVVDKDAAGPIFTVHSDYLQNAFDAIEEKFGDLDTYLAEEMGLDETTRGKLQQRYLED